ncbi:MAG: hypothetical protein JWQ32_1123, partial [Marmoricola sp.]|nr:hypothetical protein [Marmoricola sp.]
MLDVSSKKLNNPNEGPEMQHNSETETLLTPAEVAAMFRV